MATTLTDLTDLYTDGRRGIPAARTNAVFAEVETALDAREAVTDAIVAENADAFHWVNPHEAVAVSGTWTPTYATALPILTHTAAAAAEVVTFPVDGIFREAASKGLQLDTVDCWYSIDTADLDDVTLELIEFTGTADGTIPTAAVLGGDADADYDAAHDTAAERGDDTGAPEYHKLTMTPTGNVAYLGAENGLCLRLTVDGDAGPNGVFVLYGILINFTEARVDAA